MKPSNYAQLDAARQLLWEKLQQFSFDEPGTAITFQQKFAAKNGWSPLFVKRAIEEYRRFIFLCCVSPSGASPSFFVDEVWHLHLTYTKSYWLDLCRATLNRDLHHYPSKGTKEEIKKHKAWYKETLHLHEETFGEAPPHDIWPRPIEKPESSQVLQETKPFRLQPGTSSKLLFLFLLAMLVCFLISYFDTFVFPFNLKGENFLIFYGLLGVVVGLNYWRSLVQEKAAVSAFVDTYFPSDVNHFQMAYFLYGPKRAIQTALLDLADKGILRVKDGKTMAVTKHAWLQRSDNPLYPRIEKLPEGAEIRLDNIEATCSREEGFVHWGLQEMQKRLKGLLIEVVLPILFLLLGVLRFVQGQQAGRPTFYLGLLCLLFCFLFLLLRGPDYRKSIARDTVRRRYLAETETLNAEEEDPVKQYAVQVNPSLSAFAEGTVFGLSGVLFFSPQGREGKSESGGGGDSCSGGEGCGGGCGGCGCGA